MRDNKDLGGHTAPDVRCEGPIASHSDRPAPSWTLYAERKPEAAGVYEWRMPSKACKGLVVQLFAHMRERGAGYDRVISPTFDYWTGYQVIVPSGLEWREAADAPEIKSYETQLTHVEGVEIAPCPFCKAVPTLKGIIRSSGGGVICPSHPHEYNDWWTECCQWAGRVRYPDPRILADARRALLQPSTGPSNGTGGDPSPLTKAPSEPNGEAA